MLIEWPYLGLQGGAKRARIVTVTVWSKHGPTAARGRYIQPLICEIMKMSMCFCQR
jgi:hypothetical protein